jgi:hypothetical protein
VCLVIEPSSRFGVSDRLCCDVKQQAYRPVGDGAQPFRSACYGRNVILVSRTAEQQNFSNTNTNRPAGRRVTVQENLFVTKSEWLSSSSLDTFTFKADACFWIQTTERYFVIGVTLLTCSWRVTCSNLDGDTFSLEVFSDLRPSVRPLKWRDSTSD